MCIRDRTYAKALARLLPEGWLLGGGLLSEGRLVAMSLAEKCGDTLIIHVEKALYSHQGAYPTLVQAFAAHFGGDCTYINRCLLYTSPETASGTPARQNPPH